MNGTGWQQVQPIVDVIPTVLVHLGSPVPFHNACSYGRIASFERILDRLVNETVSLMPVTGMFVESVNLIRCKLFL